jgi:hypothetical protein
VFYGTLLFVHDGAAYMDVGQERKQKLCSSFVWGYHTASLRLVVNKNQRTQ